jgi:2-polyprenyl-6-methoxyphenol hydroxylase-like FAD-dependent oxidoreductase
VQSQSVLIIGGGIAGLTSAIALGGRGHQLDIIEKDPEWSVYGVGIIQQANVVRAVVELGIIDDYIDAAFGFNFVEVYKPDGNMAARIPVRPLVEGYPANVGIGRPALQKVLGDRAIAAGAKLRLGVTAEVINDDGKKVTVGFSDGTTGEYDLVVGADGIYSKTRSMVMPDAAGPKCVGQVPPERVLNGRPSSPSIVPNGTCSSRAPATQPARSAAAKTIAKCCAWRASVT